MRPAQFVVLLFSIVESQLTGVAEHIGKKRGVRLRVKHIAGRGIEQAAVYLEHILSVPVKAEREWHILQDLQAVRNIIVHRAGARGDHPTKQNEADDLARKYKGKLDFPEQQLWISMNLCRDWVTAAERFFEQTFRLAGLPSRPFQKDQT